MFTHNNADTNIEVGDKNILIHNIFMNYSIISCVMNKILVDNNYPSYVPYMWSYVCRDKYNILVNMKKMKTQNEISLNPNIAKTSANLYTKQTFERNSSVYF